MKIKSQRDFWSGLMFVAVGVVFAAGARHYPLGSSASPGPGYFPLALSVIMAVLGAIIVFKALTFEADGGDPIGPIAWRALAAIVGAIVLFGATLTRWGLLLAVPLLVATCSLAAERPRWREVLAGAAVLTLAAWLLFVVVLKLPIALWPGAARA